MVYTYVLHVQYICPMSSEATDKKARKPQIGVEVTPEEKSIIEKVAKYKGMKAATLLRALALQEARTLGILKD
jgi:hypothetical protein